MPRPSRSGTVASLPTSVIAPAGFARTLPTMRERGWSISATCTRKAGSASTCRASSTVSCMGGNRGWP